LHKYRRILGKANKKARKTPGLEKIEFPGTDPVRFAQGKLTGHWEERVSLAKES
jgi:hypothetical protein